MRLSILFNILWLICGGALMALGWFVAGFVMALTIVGLPWARSAFSIARYSLLPFGHRVVHRAAWTGHEDFGTGALGTLGNLVWLALAGWWLALGHLGAALLLAATLIGLPFAWAHLKLAGLALWPVGRMVVPDAAAPAYARWR